MATAYIIINGVSMSENEYKAYRKSHMTTVHISNTPSRANNVVTPRQFVGLGVEDIMREMGVIDSLLAYSRNGYRQWGNTHTMVMNLKEISSPYIRFKMAAHKLNDTATKIERYARRNSRQIPSLLEEMGWHLQDTREALDKLVQGIRKSEVLYGLQGCKCIYENGKRLGLSVLTSRSERALGKMTEAINELKEMENELNRY